MKQRSCLDRQEILATRERPMDLWRKRWANSNKTQRDAYQKIRQSQGYEVPIIIDWFYWAKRMGKDPRLPKRVAQLLKKLK